MHGHGLLRGSGLSRADGPDRFVGDDQAGTSEPRGIVVAEGARQLPPDDVILFAGLALGELLADPESTYRRLPLRDLGGLEELVPYYAHWLEHDTRDEFWLQTAPNERYGSVTTPALHMGGWYDIFAAGTIENFVRLQAEAATEKAAREFLLANGVSAADFEKQYRTFSTENKLRQAENMSRRYLLDHTPMFVVHGKYLTDAEMAGSLDQLFQLVSDLAAREHTAN